MKSKILKSIVFIFLFSNYNYAQKNLTIEKIFESVEKRFINEKYYHYTTQYKFYENSISKKEIESNYGVILKNGDISYQKMGTMESISSSDHNGLIDHEKKTIRISQIKNSSSLIVLKTYLAIFAKKKIVSDKKYWICELSTDKTQMSQYDKTRFYISKDDFSLQKQVFYIKGKQEIVKNKKRVALDNPRLEIALLEKNEKTDREIFLTTLKNYFTIKGKKIIPADRFKNYKVIIL